LEFFLVDADQVVAVEKDLSSGSAQGSLSRRIAATVEFPPPLLAVPVPGQPAWLTKFVREARADGSGCKARHRFSPEAV